MKIVFILNHFLPDHIAGTEIYTWALSKQLINKNHEVVVITPNFKSQSITQYEYEGIKVNGFPASPIQEKKIIMGLKLPKGLNEFKNIIEKENPDIIHFQEYSRGSGISVEHIKIAKSFNKPIITTFHIAQYSCQTNELIYKGKQLCDGIININKCSRCYLHKKKQDYLSEILIPLSNILNFFKIDSRCWGNKIGTALGTTNTIKNLNTDLLKSISLSTKIIVLTDWYNKILINNQVPKDKLVIIKQGLPQNIFTINNNSIAENQLKLIYIGRITFEKGLHILIDAVSKFKEYQIELDIYGQSTDLKYESDLKLKSLHLKNIKWKGILKKEDVQSTISNYDFLCLCSNFSEMSPLVIQEAFSVGVPVIASNVYGNAEQIKNGYNGLLFDNNNVNSLIEQLNKCISNRNLRENLRNNISTPRKFESVANEHISLYSSLMNLNL